MNVFITPYLHTFGLCLLHLIMKGPNKIRMQSCHFVNQNWNEIYENQKQKHKIIIIKLMYSLNVVALSLGILLKFVCICFVKVFVKCNLAYCELCFHVSMMINNDNNNEANDKTNKKPKQCERSHLKCKLLLLCKYCNRFASVTSYTSLWLDVSHHDTCLACYLLS